MRLSPFTETPRGAPVRGLRRARVTREDTLAMPAQGTLRPRLRRLLKLQRHCARQQREQSRTPPASERETAKTLQHVLRAIKCATRTTLDAPVDLEQRAVLVDFVFAAMGEHGATRR